MELFAVTCTLKEPWAPSCGTLQSTLLSHTSFLRIPIFLFPEWCRYKNTTNRVRIVEVREPAIHSQVSVPSLFADCCLRTQGGFKIVMFLSKLMSLDSPLETEDGHSHENEGVVNCSAPKLSSLLLSIKYVSSGLKM